MQLLSERWWGIIGNGKEWCSSQHVSDTDGVSDSCMWWWRLRAEKEVISFGSYLQFSCMLNHCIILVDKELILIFEPRTSPVRRAQGINLWWARCSHPNRTQVLVLFLPTRPCSPCESTLVSMHTSVTHGPVATQNKNNWETVFLGLTSSLILLCNKRGKKVKCSIVLKKSLEGTWFGLCSSWVYKLWQCKNCFERSKNSIKSSSFLNSKVIASGWTTKLSQPHCHRLLCVLHS